MNWLFQKFGADWNQFKTLLSISILTDFRGHRTIGRQRRKLSPLVWTLIFYGIMGLSLAASLVPRAKVFLFSLLILTASMVMMAFAVILEFGNTIINPEDTDVLAFRPISPRTYFLAKLCNLLFYIFLIGTALCLFPSLIGIAVAGSNWVFPLIFFPIAMIANLVAASFIILIYTGLLRMLPYERFKDILAYLQIVFTFLLFFSYQLIPRLSEKFIHEGTELSGTWLYAVPSAWFAGSVQILMGKARPIDSWLTLTALVATVLLFFVSFRRISLQYAHQIANLQTKERKRIKAYGSDRKGLLNFLARKFLPTGEALAGFQLTSSMLKKDRYVKMSLYPILGLPLAFLALTMVDNSITDPFIHRSFLDRIHDMSYLVIFLIFFMFYTLQNGLLYAQEWEASWLYRVAPITSPGRLYQGVKLALLLRLILPFFLLLGFIYSIKIPLIHSIQHTIFLFLSGLVVFSTVSFSIKDYPFSKKREKGERTQQFVVLIFIMPFFALAVLVQNLFYSSNLAWWIAQIGFIVLFLALESIVVKRMDSVLKHKEFLS
ncbi:MAG: hypothetical protein DRP89_07565 [Candidatus Neomarinimicrobiota bacterium]|nr:MAG: hypothetical protein DRP89_07565 [Candidatus Neomarinimicrobiota bacterium]